MHIAAPLLVAATPAHGDDATSVAAALFRTLQRRAKDSTPFSNAWRAQWIISPDAGSLMCKTQAATGRARYQVECSPIQAWQRTLSSGHHILPNDHG
jgi:hypothetical protein